MGILTRMKNFFTGKPDKIVSRIRMVSEASPGFYAWNGKLYQSDIVRACIRPKTQAIGKITGKHIRENDKGMKVNPDAWIKFLLEEPNPYMTGQMLQEKLANQLALNGNAFALIIRNEADGTPMEIYPIPATSAEALYGEDGALYLRFTYLNGRQNTFAYTDIIHLRRDFYDQDIFGASQVEALNQIMECIGTLDLGIVNAIKSSGVVRWLLKLPSSTRKEDVRAQAREFARDYLSTSSETLGVAGVSASAEAKQITPTDIMPNSKLMQSQIERVYAFFNTNEKIVTSAYSDNEWNAYYNNEIEPVVKQFSDLWTQKLFNRRERARGNKIVFEAMDLQYASISTKLQIVSIWDRGIMSRNEYRRILNMAPIPGGDDYYIRLDTAKADTDTDTNAATVEKVEKNEGGEE